MNIEELRHALHMSQMRDGEAARMLELLYEFQDHICSRVPTPNSRHRPLINLERDTRGKWFGKFSSVGPFGFSNVITLNLASFRTADDMLITLTHEVVHWSWQDTAPGHSDEWAATMLDEFGLVCNEGALAYYSGKWIETLSEWNELVEELARIRLS